VLVPRHPVRAPQLERMVEDAQLRATVHSRLESAADDVVVGDVLIGDVMGSLLTLYGVADIAFVGGSLVPVGGHNPIEAAVWGIPVVMGPFDFNFADVLDDFRAAGAVIGVNDAMSLARTLAELVAAPEWARDIGARGAELVRRRAGALERTLTALEEVLSLVAD
jgi:3-deoxy-D-manno-octulosonic-acid transferase